MSKTNFDLYLEQKLADPDFAERFKQAGHAWDVSLQIAGLRHQAGLSQSELANRLQTTQKQISRLESPSYEGHSLRMLRRVADELDAELAISFKPRKAALKTKKTTALIGGRSGRRAKKVVVRECGGTYGAVSAPRKKAAAKNAASRTSRK